MARSSLELCLDGPGACPTKTAAASARGHWTGGAQGGIVAPHSARPESRSFRVWPIFGPSTLRDTPSLVVDRILLNPLTYVELKTGERIAIIALDVVSVRAELLSLEETVEDIPRLNHINRKATDTSYPRLLFKSVVSIYI